METERTLCICRCMANWKGHCVAKQCEGQFTLIDAKPVADERMAAERYAVMAKLVKEMWGECHDD